MAESPQVSSRYLLDTHIVVRWLTEPKKLSARRSRALREAMRRREPVSVSAISLLEIAVLFGRDRAGASAADDIFGALQSNAALQIEPLTIEVAAEVAALGAALRDPADRAIVCTARVRGLRLLTSDERIIDSQLVPVLG